MAENNLLLPYKNFFKSLDPWRRFVFISVLGACVAMLILFIFVYGQSEYETALYNISPEEAPALAAKLRAGNIDSRISADGRRLEVPRDKVPEARIMLASQGLAQGGVVGFELFDQSKAGLTEFEHNVKYQRALQGELARTISWLSEVEGSRVHIVMGSDSLFAEQEKPASASVILKLRPGSRVSGDRVKSIVHIISTSVPGLKPQNVTIVDNRGNMLAGNRDVSKNGEAGSDQFEYRGKVERNLESRIKTMLEDVLGPGKAIVRVSAEIDFNRREITEEEYIPGNQVARSEQTMTETSTKPGEVSSGAPGVMSNMSDLGWGASASSGNSTFNKEEKTANYEIGKKISHIVEPMGRIVRISAAVIVDGVYNPVLDESGEATEELKYAARSATEIRQFEKIVRRAINYEEGRDLVEVTNIRFEKAGGDAEAGDEWVSYDSGYKQFRWAVLVFGCILAGFFLYIVWRVLKMIVQGAAYQGGMVRQLPMTVGEMEKEYGESAIGLNYKDRAMRTIRKDKDHSVKVMRDWMKEK